MSNFLQSIGNTVSGVDSSRQLALGIAIGAWIGILPKDNLLFAGLLVFLIISGANLLTGMISAIAISLLNTTFEIYTHQLGEMVMSLDFVLISLSKFLQLPVAPWTRLDNTVVLGSFLIGLSSAVPIYVMSFYVFEKYRLSVKKMLTENRLSNWVTGAPQIDTGNA